MNVPVWLLVTDSRGDGSILMESDPDVVVIPPPLTPTLLLTGLVALADTVTLMVNVG